MTLFFFFVQRNAAQRNATQRNGGKWWKRGKKGMGRGGWTETILGQDSFIAYCTLSILY